MYVSVLLHSLVQKWLVNFNLKELEIVVWYMGTLFSQNVKYYISGPWGRLAFDIECDVTWVICYYPPIEVMEIFGSLFSSQS